MRKYNKKIEVSSDKYGRLYVSNIGWFITKKPNKLFYLKKNDDKYKLYEYEKNKRAEFTFEPISLIKSTNIELMQYPIALFNQCYYDVDENLIDVEIEDITKRQKKNLEKAFQLIKKHSPEQYKLIDLVVKKNVIFNIDSGLRNSFATLKAHGAAFYNCYQEDYSEVFFVDDIAHQTGHCIFYTLLEDTKKFIKVDSSTKLETISYGINETETRDVYILFHALYTYYTSLKCLDACLASNSIKGLKRHEALGRIWFYIRKCNHDILLVENSSELDSASQKLFTQQGLYIYKEIKETLKEMATKWYQKVKKFDLSNQPYNFTFSKFLELNPLNEITN